MKQEKEALRRLLRVDLEEQAPRLPREDEGLRARLLDAAVEEALAEAERREGTR